MNLFYKYLVAMLGLFLGSILIIGLPLLLTIPSLGKGFVLSSPPILLMVISWMACGWFFRHDNLLFFVAAMGSVPVRIGLGLGWSSLVFGVADQVGIHKTFFVYSMMFHWIVFTIVEVCMMCALGDIPIKQVWKEVKQ